MEPMEYENTESAPIDTGVDITETEPPAQPSGTDENASGTENSIEIENEPDSEIFTSSETETSSETIESSEIADSSETEMETTVETETVSEIETETTDGPESSEIADSSETETATESAAEIETAGTLTISDNPHDGGDTAANSTDTLIADMITALGEQLDNDRERMSVEHTELLEKLDSVNTTATFCVSVLLCILLCTGALLGANLARAFWERLRN